DVNDLTHVINYELPDELESYTHRSGRTGRAGNQGISIGMAGHKERKKIRKLEKTIKQKFEQVEPPTAADILKKQVKQWSQKVKDADTETVQSVMPALMDAFEDLDREALIRQFAAFQ